ncbi:MAG: Wzz/FepE/Etk N-terminal domain-containing protein [Candidatus Zixiibacteriota bacterium]
MTDSQSNNFWLFLELLAKRKRLIFVIIILATAVSVVVSLVLPKWYSSTALLLPPKNMSTPIGEMSDWSQVVSVTGGLELPMRATPSDVYIRMLKSRTITSRIMDSFNLMERYGTGNWEETYLALMEHANMQVSDEGLLVISVEDKDPQMAADIANAFVKELENVNTEIVAERINQTRAFLEDRLEQVKKEMDSSRAALEAFQMKYRAVDFDEQTRLAIDQAAALKIMLAEIDLEISMKAFVLGKDNVELLGQQRKRQTIKKQLEDLENRNPDSSFFSLPVSLIPSLRGQYEMLYSRVQVAEGLYQVLLEQSEKAKIKEYEKMPTISVLDPAKPATLKSRPQRSIIVAGTFGLSVLFAIFFAALLEYFAKLRQSSPEDYGRLVMFVEAFFGWLPGVKKTKRTGSHNSQVNT